MSDSYDDYQIDLVTGDVFSVTPSGRVMHIYSPSNPAMLPTEVDTLPPNAMPTDATDERVILANAVVEANFARDWEENGQYDEDWLEECGEE